MSGINLKPSQRAGVVGVIDPQSANAAKTSAWIDSTAFMNFLAIIKVGALGAGSTVDAKIQQATSVGGAGAKDVAGKAITQLTKAAPNDDEQVTIDLKQEDLDFNNGFKFFQLSVTPAVAACLIDATILGFDPRYGVATDNDATTVVQNV